MKSRAKQIIDGYESLKTHRSTFEESLRDITYYVLPEFEQVNEDTRGDSDPDRPVSSTAGYFSKILGSNMYAYTYRQGEENLSLRSVRQDDDSDAKDWLTDATKKFNKALQNSNFPQVYGEMCTIYPTYGTGCVSSEYDKDRAELVFQNHSINGNIYFTENSRGIVSGIYRLLRFTAQQAIEKYGKGLPEEIHKAAGDPSRVSEKFDFIQKVTENSEYNPKRKEWKSWKYRSVHVYRKDEIIIHEEGFRTFPFACPRFEKRGFVYGYGAGHSALNAIRELNRVQADLPDAIEMQVHKPTMFPNEDAAGEYASRPNHVGYYDATQGQPWQPDVSSDENALVQYMQMLYQEVSSLFFVDTFLSITSRWDQDKTAREVDEMSEEKLSTIAPIISRLQSEFWTPVVERGVDLLIDAGIIDPPPPSIAEEGFRVAYTSRIDSKLAVIEVNKLLQAASEAQRLILMEQETPEITDVLNIKDAAQDILEKRNVDADLIVRKIERNKKIKSREDSMEGAEQLENMRGMAKPVDLSKTPEPGSPIEQMAGVNV